MNDQTLTIILAALPPTLVALATFVVGIVNSIKANKIHYLVNSNMTKVQADLAAANVRIEELQKLVGKLVGLKEAATIVSEAKVGV